VFSGWHSEGSGAIAVERRSHQAQRRFERPAADRDWFELRHNGATSLKRVLDASYRGMPVLFLLDEMLHGTNALCELSGDLNERSAFVHIREHIANGEMRFDYRLYPGPGTAGKALRLMNQLGNPNGSGFDSAHLDNTLSFDVQQRLHQFVPYTSESDDDLNQFSVASHAFTSFFGDNYLVCASLRSPGADFRLEVLVDNQDAHVIAVSNDGIAQGCRTVWLDPGHYVLVYAAATSGTVSFAPEPYWSWLSVSYAGGAASLDGVTPFDLPTAQFAKVLYETPLYGTAPAGNYRALLDGQYRVCASMMDYYTTFELDLFVNGNRNKAFAVSHQGYAQGCSTVHLNTGNTVDVRAYQYGAPVTISRLPTWNWITVDRVAVSASSAPNIQAFTANTGEFTQVPYSPSPSYAATIEGQYTVCASLASFTGDFELDLFVNGNRDKGLARSSYGAATGCRTVRLEPNDVVDVRVQPISASPLSFSANSLWNWMSIDTE
jgi:hypothetical protein